MQLAITMTVKIADKLHTICSQLYSMRLNTICRHTYAHNLYPTPPPPTPPPAPPYTLIRARIMEFMELFVMLVPLIQIIE